jgi:outer membrane lipoprotein carrier protein
MSPALLTTALLLAAAARDPVPLAREVQAFYEHTRDLEADFAQTYTYAAFGRTQASRGKLQVKKPGKLRWDYVEPSRKTIVVNGSRLVQYEPEVNQAYVDEHFDSTAMSAAVTFLLGKGSLEKEFDLAVDPEGRLVLTPKVADPRVERVVLTVGPSGEVTATRVVDGNGNVNELTFHRIRRNVGLSDAAFVLKLPADVHQVKPPSGAPASGASSSGAPPLGGASPVGPPSGPPSGK